MAGLVPAIYAATLRTILELSLGGTAWMAGTSPAKTRRGCIDCNNGNPFAKPDSRAHVLAITANPLD
jgi:hypothetical protein